MKHSTNLRSEDEAIFSDTACVGLAYGWDDGGGCGSKELAVANARLWATAPKLLALLLESQANIGGDWRVRRDAAIMEALGG